MTTTVIVQACCAGDKEVVVEIIDALVICFLLMLASPLILQLFLTS